MSIFDYYATEFGTQKNNKRKQMGTVTTKFTKLKIVHVCKTCLTRSKIKQKQMTSLNTDLALIL
jgi:hypothetical protein